MTGVISIADCSNLWGIFLLSIVLRIGKIGEEGCGTIHCLSLLFRFPITLLSINFLALLDGPPDPLAFCLARVASPCL